MDVLQSVRLVFRGKYLSVSHLQRRTLSFQRFTSCAGRKWQHAADGFWLGSSEQVAFSIANITYTLRDFLSPLTPAVQTYLLHMLKQTKTNTERCLFEYRVPSASFLSPFLASFLFCFPEPYSPPPPGLLFLLLPAERTTPRLSWLLGVLLLVFSPPSCFPPFLLWDCCCVLWLFIPTWC